MYCPNCQNQVEPGMKFCGACGTVLPEPEPVAEPIAQPVEEIVAEPAEVLEAEAVKEPVAEEPVTTVYCPKCAQVNALGDRFCMKCGYNLEGVPATAQAPVVMAAAAGGTMEKVEEFAKKSAKKAEKLAKKGAKEAEKLAKKGAEEAEKLAKKGAAEAKKLPKPVLFAMIGVAAVIVIVVGILVLSAVFGGSNDNYAFYLKDSEIFYSDFSKKDPAEITSRLVDSSGVDAEDVAEAATIIRSYMAMTDGGNRLFYPDKIGDDEGVTIYYRDLGKLKKEPVKLDSEIIMYAVAQSGKEVIYLKGEEGTLYRSDLKDKEKIASDVQKFYVSDDLKTVIYLNDEDNLYLQNKGSDKEKIVSGVESLEQVSEDLSTIYYTKDGSLYVQEIGKDRVKIGENVEYVANILDSGEVYYTTGETREITMMDFVEDDMAAADAAMEEPVYPEYPEYPYYWEYDTDEEYDAAYAEYELAWEEYERLEDEYWDLVDLYYEKEDRDWLREDLKNYTEEITDYTLFYFDGKDSVEVMSGLTSRWVDDYAYDAAVVAVSAFEEGETPKVKLSEIEGVWEVSDLVYEARHTDTKQYVVTGAAAFQVDLEDAWDVRISSDGKTLTYFADVDEEDNEGELHRAEIKKDALGKTEKLDEDVHTGYITELADGKLVYFKDVNTYEGKGDLFIDGVEVDYDVFLYSVRTAEELGGILYYTDYDENKGEGTLKLYKNKKSEKIADDVASYYLNEVGELVYLYDYSDRHYTGSLYIYNGGKAKKIDEDVIALLPDYGLYEVMHGSYYFW